MSAAHTLSNPLIAVAPGRWTTVAGPEWSNPGGGLWGGYAIGLCIRVLEAEPEAVGEALSLTLTYAAGLPSGELDIRTRRLRQGGSVGVWEVELLPAGSDQVGVHGIVTMARRPEDAGLRLRQDAEAPAPESLPVPDVGGEARHYGASAFERRTLEGFPPTPIGRFPLAGLGALPAWAAGQGPAGHDHRQFGAAGDVRAGPTS